MSARKPLKNGVPSVLAVKQAIRGADVTRSTTAALAIVTVDVSLYGTVVGPLAHVVAGATGVFR